MSRFEKLAGLAAALALFVYALSCRPSWSPDSSAIAFTYSTDKVCGVAVHDVKADRTENVITFSAQGGEIMPQVLWQGGKVVVLCHKEQTLAGAKGGRILVMEYDPAMRAFGTVSMLDFGESQPSPVVPPVAGADGRIFMSGIEKGECAILEIAPDRSSVKSVGPQKILILERGGERIFYAAMNGDETVSEVGLFDPVTQEFKALEGFESSEAGRLNPSLAVAPDGSRCCITVSSEMGRSDVIIVDAGDGGESVRRAGLPETFRKIGGAAFAADSQAVWMAAIEKQEESGKQSVVLAEFVIEDEVEERVQRRVVLPIAGKEIDDNMAMALQPTISPDGRWLALSTFVIEKEKPSRLFLVDLESPDLDLKIVAAPVAAAGGR